MPPRTIRCPDCDNRFILDSHDAAEGRVVCRQCGATIPIRDVVRPRDGSRSKSGGKSSIAVWLVAGIVLFVLFVVLCCGGLIYVVYTAMQPHEFPEQLKDYAEARKTFKTKLVQSGPSPQAQGPVLIPQGATAIAYDSGSLKLKAWINKPAAGDKPKPAVLYLHGGFAFGEDDWDQCQPFRDAGFVTMTPILRGENGQPGNFSLFYDEVDDAIAAAELLAKTPGVDPNRLFVAGHSAGGTLALLTAMTSKRFKGCASFSGSPDQVTFLRDEPDLVKFDQTDPNEYAMRSPLAFPKSFKCPVRLYWGDDEPPQLFLFSSQKLAEKATANGQDVQAISVPGDHDTAVAPAMKLAIAFFQQK